MGTQAARHYYRQHANQQWADRCRVVQMEGKLVALPYLLAKESPDYEIGATLASISANRLIRQLLAAAKA